MRSVSLLLIFPSLLPADSLRGRILDPSGAAAPGVVVRLQSRDGAAQWTAVSDAKGDYRFETLPGATYLATADAKDLVAPAMMVQVAGDTTQDLQLSLARVTARYAVTPSATTQPLTEITKAFDVVDREEMDRRAEFSIVEALRLVPGLRVAQLGGPGALTRIHTRGLRARDTALLIDGFRFRDATAPEGDATAFLGDLLVIETARVEVLRGSGSSLYGTNAMGGVINLVTDQGGGPWRGDLTVEGGGLGLFRGLARTSGSFFRNRLQLSGGLAHLDVTRGVDGNDPVRNTSGQGYLRWLAGPRTSLLGRVMANDSLVGLNSTPSAMPVSQLGTSLPAPATLRTFIPSLDDPDSRRVSRFFTGMVGVTHQLAPSVSIRATYQGLDTWRDNRNGPAGPGFQSPFNTAARYDSRIDTAQARTDWSLGRRHLVTAGYEFEREDYDNRASDANPNPAARTDVRVRANQRSHAAFAQEQIRLAGDRLQVALSARIQSFQLNQPSFEGGAPRYAGLRFAAPPNAYTGDAALAYFVPSTATKLRAHVGNSYRSPALYERFGTGFFGGAFTPYGDPGIAPERSVAVDSGVDQYLARDRVRLSATYFYTRLQQVIGFDFSGLINRQTDPFGRSSGYRNTGGGLARGGEFSAEMRLDSRLRVQASYTYTNSIERQSTLLGGSVRTIRISPHVFTALVSRSFGHGFDLTFDLFAASSYWYPFFAGGSRPFQFAGPKKADLVASYTRPLKERWSVQVYGRVDNVFNRTYYEDGFRTPKAWLVAGLKLLR